MRSLLVLVLAAVSAGQTVEFKRLKEGVLEDRLKLAHPKNSERYRRLKALLEESGCRDERLREQPVKGVKEPNMICGVDGTGGSPRKIVVGAHFDSVGGDGVIDNWSGAVLLPSLYQFAGEGQRRHSFEFVAFTGEERGLLGSKSYVKSLTKAQRDEIAAVIVMDSIGLTPTKCWPNGSSEDLVLDAAIVARSMKLDFQGVNVEQVATTDSAPFKAAGIPVLCLHSVTAETIGMINGRRDVWKAVSWKDYYDTHRLISALLVYLDRKLP